MSPYFSDSLGARRKPGRNARQSRYRSSDPLLRCLLALCGIFGAVDLTLLHEGLDNTTPENALQNEWHPSNRQYYRKNGEFQDKRAGEMTKAVEAIAAGRGGYESYASLNKIMDLGNDETNRIKATLRRAGVRVDADLFSKLPKWSDMTAIYGSQPVILGLERCEAFRKSVGDPARAMIGPAGQFNTGTNLLEQLLYRNCAIPGARARINGMRRNVPWGKHTPASYRLRFNATQDGNVSHTDTLAVVMVKDIFSWMGSMCRHEYAAFFNHSKEHCPNLVPNEVDHRNGIYGQGRDKVVPVGVRFNDFNFTFHTSLVHLWNDWYGEYHSVTWPRLIVRFEDLLFYPEFVITKVCQCAGGTLPNENFLFLEKSAKGGAVNEDSSGLLQAVMKYGRSEQRVVGFTAADIAFAKKHVRGDLMAMLNYSYPSGGGAAARPV